MPFRKKDDPPIPADCPEELRCSRCKQAKPRGEFPRNRSTRTTFSYTCKGCDKDFEIMRRFRREIERDGIDSFCEATGRELEILAMRYAVASEYLEPEPGA